MKCCSESGSSGDVTTTGYDATSLSIMKTSTIFFTHSLRHREPRCPANDQVEASQAIRTCGVLHWLSCLTISRLQRIATGDRIVGAWRERDPDPRDQYLFRV